MKNTLFLTLFFIGLLFNTSFIAQTWNSISFPSRAAQINDVFETANGELYAISFQGLYKSIDSGTNWIEISSVVSGNDILTITTSGYILYEDGQTIMRYTPDNEIEFIINYALIHTANQSSATMVSFNNNNILLSMRGLSGWSTISKTFRSTDNGATFEPITDLPELVNHDNFSTTRFYKNTTSDLAYYIGADDNIYKTTDSGMTFQATGVSTSASGDTFFIDASGDLFMIESLNIYKSVDEAASFTQISTESYYASSIYTNGDRIYIIQFSEMLGSTDAGATFTNLDNLFPINANALIEQHIPDNSYMTNDGTFLCFYNGFTHTITEPIIKVAEDNLSTSYASSGIDMAIVDGMSSNGSRIAASFTGFVNYSDDNGVSWTAIADQGGWANIVQVLDDGTVMTSSNLYSGGTFRVLSNDTTEEVFENGNSINNVFNIFEDSQGNVLISTISGIYYSSDGVNFELSDSSFSGLDEVEIWDDPTTNRIYASTQYITPLAGISLYSDNGGETWIVGASPGSTSNRLFRGLHGVWSSSWPDGMFHSTDLENWNNTSEFVEIEGSVIDMFEGGDALFLSTAEHIYKSTNSGSSWEIFENGINIPIRPNYNSSSMVEHMPAINFIGESGKLLLSVNGSMYIMDDAPVSITEQIDVINKVTLFPNPASSTITLSTKEKVDNVKIYNTKGQLILQTTEAKNIDIISLSEGVYFVKIIVGGAITVEKFIKK